jgi:GntR family transcriptional regulator, rspAB operon transcriptional repressor
MAQLLRDDVYRSIRQAILSCEFMPGQQLREHILADKYRVSRSPIRDSLLRLEQENLVTVRPRQGYVVNPISKVDIAEIFTLRRYIEPACAAEAARASDQAVRTLDRFSGFTGEETYEGANLDYNRSLHKAIADLAGNSRLAAVEYALVEEYDRLVKLSSQAYDEQDISSSTQQHQAIIDAIQAHDADTAYRLSEQRVVSEHARVVEPLVLAAEPRNGQ